MEFTNGDDIREALTRVGQLLAAEGKEYAIVVLGGAALDLLEIVRRDTSDVDILAFAEPRPEKPPAVATIGRPPEPMPEALRRAAQIVAEELDLDEHWLNTGPALQWRAGLPPGLEARVMWELYGSLWVGLVHRYDLVFFKLFAATDSTGPRSVHYQDLIALKPSATELSDAVRWVETQDASPDFARILQQVVSHVRKDLRLE